MTKPDLTPPSDAAQCAGERFAKLVELMRTLRSSVGCAWDREQTLASLRPFILEEAYEVVDAIDRNSSEDLCDELGDLLLEAVFVAQICAETGEFTIADSANAINAKLIRRHPHVFGKGAAHELSSREVKAQWDQIKSQERGERTTRSGLLDDIPDSLPSLMRASRIGARTARVGFDWDESRDVLEKVDEELTELREAIDADEQAHVDEELGDLLFTLANLARKLNLDPESSLRSANQKFKRRFQLLEENLSKQGKSLHEATSEELEQEWRTVKLTPRS